MAANFPSRTTLRIVAVLSLLAVLAVVWWLTFAKADVEERTVVRLTRAMATGDYLTGDDIEAVRITLAASDAGQYITTEQAAHGLLAAHDLAVGDLLLVPDVYTTRSDQIDVRGSTSEPADGQAVSILAAGIGLLGVVAIGAHLARRRPSQRVATVPPNSDATPATRQWVHLEVNAWVGGEARGTTPPETSTAGWAGVGSLDGMASLAGTQEAAPRRAWSEWRWPRGTNAASQPGDARRGNRHPATRGPHGSINHRRHGSCRRCCRSEHRAARRAT